MGDRSTTIFIKKWGSKVGMDEVSISPGIYMHWRGSETLEMIQAAGSVMRKFDVAYSAARFCGYCHEHIEPNLGLGLLDAPTKTILKSNKKLSEWGPGDNGVFIVNVDTGMITNVRMDYELGCGVSVDLGFVEMAGG